MLSSGNNPSRFGSAVLVAASLFYPGLVYVGRGVVSPLVFVAVALGLIGLRLAMSSSPAARLWRPALLGVAAAIAGLAALDGHLAAKAYPVVVSLGMAALFGLSLLRPPSLIERIARLKEPDLPPAGQAYCRTVTLVWTVWLLANATVAAALALWGGDALWALWTGVLAYAVMGLLFAGEVLVRRVVRRRQAAA